MHCFWANAKTWYQLPNKVEQAKHENFFKTTKCCQGKNYSKLNFCIHLILSSMYSIGPPNRLFSIATKRWLESRLCSNMLDLLIELLWSITLSAPSFGRYWKQLIQSPYGNVPSISCFRFTRIDWKDSIKGPFHLLFRQSSNKVIHPLFMKRASLNKKRIDYPSINIDIFRHAKRFYVVVFTKLIFLESLKKFWESPHPIYKNYLRGRVKTI